MPRSAGHELAKWIKAARPSIELIFMSGYSGPSVIDRGVLDPAVTYLQKPFSPEGLATTVGKVLGLLSPKGTILVFDEEPGVGHSLRNFPTRIGYEVLEAANGIEVVEQLRLYAVDVVLLDLVMPKREGIKTPSIRRKERPQGYRNVGTVSRVAPCGRAAWRLCILAETHSAGRVTGLIERCAC